MSYHFIDRKDPHIDVMFQGLEKFVGFGLVDEHARLRYLNAMFP